MSLIKLFTHNYRLVIETPEQYDQLKSGQIGSDQKRVIIGTDGHPTPLLLPTHFANADEHYAISFVDDNGNMIQLYPQTRQLLLSVAFGEIPLDGLPLDYDGYDIEFEGGQFTPAYIDAFLQWKQIKFAQINDQNNAAYEILQRIEEFSELKELSKIVLNLQQDSYKKVILQPFLEKLPALEQAFFLFDKSMNQDEIDEFVDGQNIPDNWKAVKRDGLIKYQKDT